MSKSCRSLVVEWTKQAQNGSNTDDERAVYERCAKELHELNGDDLLEEYRNVYSYRNNGLQYGVLLSEWLEKVLKYLQGE